MLHCIRCTRRREETNATLITLSRVLLGGLRGELDREWCVSAGGDQTLGGAGSSFRFNLSSNTLPLSSAKQQELQVR